MKVFISYTGEKDIHLEVSRLRERLEAALKPYDRTTTVFQDKATLKPGDRIDKEIRRALKSIDVLLVLVSPAWFRAD